MEALASLGLFSFRDLFLMTASDKNKAFLLVVLLIVGGLAYYYMVGFETVAAPATAARVVRKAERPTELWDAEIQFNLLKDTAADNVGQKNLFQYLQHPAPAKTPEIVTARGPLPPPTPPPGSAPEPPALPSLRAFRYEGFSLTKETRKILASLNEGGNTYRVEQG